jgi:ribose transport system permease protein
LKSELTSRAPASVGPVGGAAIRAIAPVAPVLAAAVIMFVAVTMLGQTRISYFQISSIASGMAPLALTAIGETIVILARGFDLSAGATVSLSNVIFASQTGTSIASQFLWSLAALASGAVVGAVNGYFIAYRRLQPIVVTLATMFIVAGVNLLILPAPGGTAPPESDSAPRSTPWAATRRPPERRACARRA